MINIYFCMTELSENHYYPKFNIMKFVHALKYSNVYFNFVDSVPFELFNAVIFQNYVVTLLSTAYSKHTNITEQQLTRNKFSC